MNKKLNVLFLMFLLVTIVFSYTVHTSDIKDKAVTSGNYTIITLNQTTGEEQSWEYEIEDKEIIEVVTESYTKQVKTEDDNIIKGVSTWYIKGLSTGRTIITFNLIDNKSEKVVDTIKYNIEVKAKNIEVMKGNLIKISLKENSSTGYTWHLNIADDEIVKVHHDRFIQPESEPGFVGKSGIHYWYIKGLNKGKTELIFKLYQDWNKEEVEKIKRYMIEVK